MKFKKTTKAILNLSKLHNHFLKGDITERASGKTTAVIYQAIGFVETLNCTDIYILCHHEDIDHIESTLMTAMYRNDINFVRFKRHEIECDYSRVKIMTYEKYMNNDFRHLNHHANDHMILFDYRNMTSVNTSPETIFKIMGRNIGEVVGACAYEVSKAFGGVKIDIQIDY